MKIILKHQKTGSEQTLCDNVESKEGVKTKDEAPEKLADEEDSKAEDKKLEFTQEEIQTLKEFISVIPELLEKTKISSESKKEEEKVVMEGDKGKEEKAKEEQEEDIDEESISDEEDDSVNDSYDSNASLDDSSNKLDLEEDVQNVFSEYYNNQLRKGE